MIALYDSLALWQKFLAVLGYLAIVVLICRFAGFNQDLKD